ncbi:MAG: metal-sensing transcriptional repressor [Pseudomonadota bacterium]|nr:metal-sensing transcriptional repressor [Pseudomonadota bacterium]
MSVEPSRKKALCARLARVEGQLRGLQKLIEADADTDKVAQQMSAARKALDKAFYAMVADLIATGEMKPEDVAQLLLKFS